MFCLPEKMLSPSPLDGESRSDEYKRLKSEMDKKTMKLERKKKTIGGGEAKECEEEGRRNDSIQPRLTLFSLESKRIFCNLEKGWGMLQEGAWLKTAYNKLFKEGGERNPKTG
uniref:Uncharacterized protein n=1 Tax=Caenorhabditis tropicalis TaxID=1561998 RepID=A0A1I7U2C7_9PELO